MVSTKLPLALLLLLTCCSYDASFRDCEIQCTNATGCPNGFMCGSEGLCRLDGETQNCTSVLGDAGLTKHDGSMSDADASHPPLDAYACTTHSECNAMTAGDCCVNPGPTGYCHHGIIIGGVCDPQ